MMRSIFTPLACSLALLSSGLLSGCGFTPMHGATGATAPLANVDIQLEKGTNVVSNQAGFFVTQRLNDRIGTQSADAPYVLKITPTYRRRRLGLSESDVATRYDVTVSAGWVLLDSKTGDRLDRGSTSSITTFNAPSGPYGVITADNVGVEQAAKETADKLIIQLARYFASEKK